MKGKKEMEDTEQFYIDFTVDDQEYFTSLCRVFEALRHDKERQINAWDDAEAAQAFQEDNQWLTFFNEQALAHFWWPSQEEWEAHRALWFATPGDQRASDARLQHPWEFTSLIEAFKNAEFKLLSCRMLTPPLARIAFCPLAWPYGGTGCLKALVEAFNCEVVSESSGP